MGTSSIDPLSAKQFCTNCGRPFATDDLVRFGSVVVCGDCKPAYVQSMREGVTSAGVLPGRFIYGGFWIRALALLLDGLIFMVAACILVAILFVVGYAFGVRLNPAAPSPALVALFWGGYALIILGFVGASVYFVTQKGGTPGKLILGLRIVSPDGARIGVGRAIGRYFAHALSGMILYIGYIIAAFDVEKRALHDHICNTRVIKVA